MPVDCAREHARVAHETRQPSRELPHAVAFVEIPAIGPHDVPRRVADDGVEAAAVAAAAVPGREDLGEFERPVEEPVRSGGVGHDGEPRLELSARQAAVATPAGVDHVGQQARRGPSGVGPEPPGAPDVGRAAPPAERTGRLVEPRERTFLLVDARGRVVGNERQPLALGHDPTQDAGEILLVEEPRGSVPAGRRAAAGRLPLQVVG